MDTKIKNGFLQVPKNIEIEGKIYHLEDVLKHTSGNVYQIKEIQGKGLVAIVTSSPFDKLIGTKAYISYADLASYKI